MTEYPGNSKRKEDKEIKDVVKEDVLPLLSAKILHKWRLVSKEWNEWIIMNEFLALRQSYCFRDISGFFCQSNIFGITFVTLSQYDYGVPSPSLEFLPENNIVIRSSSNGLLLCQGPSEDSFYICNPVNKEFVLLPKYECFMGDEPAVILAFEPSMLNMTPDYYVICAVMSLDDPVVHFDIYSSKTNIWRRCSIKCPELRSETIDVNGFYIKGVAYWFTSSNKVIIFDRKNEQFKILYLRSASRPGAILADRHGELCYIYAHHDQQYENTYTFKFYGVIDSSLKLSVSVDVEAEITDDGIQILAFTNNNLLFFAIGTVVFSYRMKDLKAKIISTMENDPNAIRFFPYVNSLVNIIPKKKNSLANVAQSSSSA